MSSSNNRITKPKTIDASQLEKDKNTAEIAKEHSLNRTQNRQISSIRNQLRKVGDYLDKLATKRLEQRLQKPLTQAEIDEAEATLKSLITNQKNHNTKLLTALNSGLNEKKFSINDFQKLSLSQQNQILSELENKKSQITKQLNQLYQVAGINKQAKNNQLIAEFNDLKKLEEKDHYLLTIEAQEASFKKLQKTNSWQSLDKNKRKELTQQFSNLTLNSRAVFIESLETNFNSTFLADEHQQLLTLSQKNPELNIHANLANFAQKNRIERAQTIEAVRKVIIQHIQNLYGPYLDQLPEKDAYSVKKILPDPKLTKNADLSFWLAAVPTQIKRCQEVNNVLKNIPEEIKNHYGLKQKYLFEIHKLITKGIIQKTLSEKVIEAKKTFKKSLEEHSKSNKPNLNLISLKEQKDLEDAFDELTYSEQKTAVSKLLPESEIEKRQKIANSFNSLPAHIQIQNYDYLTEQNYATRSLLIQSLTSKWNQIKAGVEKSTILARTESLLTEAEIKAETDLITKDLEIDKALKQTQALETLIKHNQSLAKKWKALTQTSNFKLLPESDQKKFEEEFKNSKTTNKPNIINQLTQRLKLEAPELPTTPAIQETNELNSYERSLNIAVHSSNYELALKIIAKMEQLIDPTNISENIKLQTQKNEIEKLIAISSSDSKSPFAQEIESLLEEALGDLQADRQQLTRFSIAIESLEQQEKNKTVKSKSDSKTFKDTDFINSNSELDSFLTATQQNPQSGPELIIQNQKGRPLSAVEVKNQHRPILNQLKINSIQIVTQRITEAHPQIPQSSLPLLHQKITQAASNLSSKFLVDLSLKSPRT